MRHLGRLLLLALFASAPAAAAAEALPPVLTPLSLEEATADAQSWGLKLSPSGRYLAALQRTSKDEREDGDKKADKLDLVLIADLQDAKAKPFVHPIPDGDVRWVEWATDERLLIATAFWVDGRGQVVSSDARHIRGRVSRLLAIDRDGKNPTMLFSDNRDALRTANLANVTDFRREKPGHVVMPALHGDRLDLFSVDIYTGKSRRIAAGSAGTRLWFTDRDGKPAFRVDVNWLGTLAYIYSRKGSADVDPSDLEWEKVYTIPLRDDDNESTPDFYPLTAGPTLTTFYVAARPDGADATGIYLYDFVEKKYVRTLVTVQGIDLEDVVVERDTREYLGVQYHADRKVMKLVDPKAQARFDALGKYFGEADFYLSDFDDAQQTWLLYSEGPRDRGSWHVYRLQDKFVREVAHTLPPLDVARLGTTSVLRYQARDGLEIMGYLTHPPAGRGGARPPLIMLPHGGPEHRDSYGFDALVQLLATRGYQVFQPNFRGSSGFGKKFADAGKRQWGRAMQDDLTDAFEFLVKQGHAERERACILGGSYGGYAALAAATLTPDLYRCAVSIAGISDLRAKLKSDRRRMRGEDEAWDYMKRQIGDPDADEAMLAAASPVLLAGAVKSPVLLIHGDDDGNVPIDQSKMMDKALRKAGKDVRLVTVEDAGHGFDRDDLRKIVYPAILEFLEQHLPVAAPAPVAAAEANPSP